MLIVKDTAYTVQLTNLLNLFGTEVIYIFTSRLRIQVGGLYNVHPSIMIYSNKKKPNLVFNFERNRSKYIKKTLKSNVVFCFLIKYLKISSLYYSIVQNISPVL